MKYWYITFVEQDIRYAHVREPNMLSDALYEGLTPAHYKAWYHRQYQIHVKIVYACELTKEEFDFLKVEDCIG